MNAETDEIVCSCAGLTRSEMAAIIRVHPEIGFDEFLERSKSGGTCTACMLDLEYLFSELPRHGAGGGARLAAGKPAARESLKRRFYRLIDGLSPQVGYRLENPLPVLAGDGVATRIRVANDSLLYRGEVAAPPMRVELLVRGPDGRERWRERRLLSPGEELDEDVSRHMEPSPAGQLPAVGSVMVARMASRPGTRGTTRPQVVLRGRAGCCAVHGQAARVTTQPYWFTCLSRPIEERALVSLINVEARTLSGSIAYPHGVPGLAATSRPVTLGPRQSTMVEIRLTDAEEAATGARPFGISFLFDRLHKAHFLSASPALDRFSIDHL